MNALSAERRVLTYGAFDRFNVGHVRLLRRIAGLGDRLIVGLYTHACAASLGDAPVLSFEERREILQACQFVDHVIPVTHEDQTRTDIVNYNVGLFAMGEEVSGRFDHLSDLAQVLYLPNLQADMDPQPDLSPVAPLLRHA